MRNGVLGKRRSVFSVCMFAERRSPRGQHGGVREDTGVECSERNGLCRFEMEASVLKDKLHHKTVEPLPGVLHLSSHTSASLH